ncbi:MAG: hypothetical protein CMIDDMOC_00896 [Sodalis sp. Fle]|nr:MAG: hypothetical protein CMIDDMOC_00896 [Sodalis sp. Fle]
MNAQHISIGIYHAIVTSMCLHSWLTIDDLTWLCKSTNNCGSGGYTENNVLLLKLVKLYTSSGKTYRIVPRLEVRKIRHYDLL